MFPLACAIIMLSSTVHVSSGDGFANLVKLNHNFVKDREITEQKIDHLTELMEDLHEYVFGDIENEALISGITHHISDRGLTASSSYDKGHSTQCCRLRVPKPTSCFSYAWCPTREDKEPWIQADLGRTFEIHAVATQGRGNYDLWTTSYHIASLHNSRFLYYVDRNNGGTKNFKGNNDRTTVVRNELAPPIRAMVVRLYPVTWHGDEAIRWELYGKSTFTI